jgi:hypothetical protein
MVDIFIMRANAWSFFGPLRAFSIVGAMLCASFFPGQTGTNRTCFSSRDWSAGERPGLLSETWVPASDRSS